MSLDLHLHSHFSDGNWSPTELVEHAVSLKLKHIALTDHDTVNGIPEAVSASGGRIEIIPGVEINTLWQRDDGQGKDIHILGYFIDPANAKLLKLLERQRAERQTHTLRCIEKLSAGGIAITLQHIKEHAGKGAVGKLHLAQAIIAAGGAKDATEAFDKYLLRGSPYYVERKSVTPDQAIEAINAAGGVASIAHPGNDEQIFALILQLKKAGLRAIEAHHRAHSRKRVRELTRFARSNKMLITGGSDCHGPFKEYKSTMGTIPVPAGLLAELREAAAR